MAKNHAEKPEAMPEFEASLDEIERIIEAIETGKVSLEESLSRYSRGMKLIGHCRAILERAETKIKQLSVTADGQILESGEVACDDDEKQA